jgi:hypothetical protein
MTSNGWVNRREVAPAIPPHASCRKANSAPSKVLDGGRMCAFTVCQLSIRSWITDRLTALVDVEIERDIWSYSNCSGPTSSTALSAAATMRNVQGLLKTPDPALSFVDFLGHPDDTKLGILTREVVPLRLSGQAGSSDGQTSSDQVQWIRRS